MSSSILRSSLRATALHTSTRSTPALRVTASKSLSTSLPLSKSAVDATKDKLEDANKAVGQTLATGIDKGQQAAASAKEAVGLGAKQAQGKGAELQGEASKLAGQAKGKGAEVAGQAKGKLNEAEGALKS